MFVDLRGERQKRRYQLERQVEIALLRDDLKLIVQSLRDEVMGKLDKQACALKVDLKEIDYRLRQIERDVSALKSERCGPR